MTRQHTRWLESMFLLAGIAVLLVASKYQATHRPVVVAACPAALTALALWYWRVRHSDDQAARRSVAWLVRIVLVVTVLVPLLQRVLAP